jgi:hypothetical protein
MMLPRIEEVKEVEEERMWRRLRRKPPGSRGVGWSGAADS